MSDNGQKCRHCPTSSKALACCPHGGVRVLGWGMLVSRFGERGPAPTRGPRPETWRSRAGGEVGPVSTVEGRGLRPPLVFGAGNRCGDGSKVQVPAAEGRGPGCKSGGQMDEWVSCAHGRHTQVTYGANALDTTPTGSPPSP